MGMTSCCTIESHEAMKSPTTWPTLLLIGIQKIEDEHGNPDGELELRNCPCGSTLAIRVR
jgi:hypothetical protein